MQSNRSTGTSPEVTLRLALWHAGLRGYRKNFSRLTGKPDIAFTRLRLAVFVHGCFWHGCERCEARGRIRPPKTNTDYWVQKVARNRARFERQRAELAALGWDVIAIQECELKADLDRAVSAISAALRHLSETSSVPTV